MDEVAILLVEDSHSDVELIKEALKETGFSYRLHLASNGEEALAFLARSNDRPHLILLDLNLPKVSGIEVLKTLKQDPVLKVIPIIILTNSTSQDDLMECYEQYANAYVRKPIGYDRLSEVIRNTWRFWVDHAVLPQVGPPPSSHS